MSISSVSNNVFCMVSTAAVSAPAAAIPAASNDSAVAQSQPCGGHDHRRRNVLYDAMMSALRELGLTSTSAQPASPNSPPATTAPGAVTPATASTATPAVPATGTSATPASESSPAVTESPAAGPKNSVEDAVLSFAHALWQALRGGEDGGSRHGRDHGDDDDDGDRHHHSHHHGERNHGMTRDYSRLATRLEALATRLEPAVPTPPATPAVGTPTTTPVTKTEPVSNAAPTDTSAGVPAIAASASITIPAATPSKNPLVEAFANLLTALRGAQVGAAGPSAAQPTVSSFLHALARGLDSDVTAPSMLAVGGMINVSA